MTNEAIRDLEAVREIIKNGEHFLITTHANPDGDGIGSEIALYHYLESCGKKVSIINCSSMPNNFEFLTTNHEVRKLNEDDSTAVFKEYDAAFVLDIGNYARLKEVGQLIEFHKIPTICIDHHPKEEDKFDHYFLDTGASATGELIYDLLKGLGADFTFSIANAIYSAIMADTGSFRFSNTTEKTHKIAAEMLELGVNPESVWSYIYGDIPPERIALQVEVMDKIQYDLDGKLAWVKVSKKMLERAGATSDQLEGFADYIRNIRGVKASVVLLELNDDLTKMSFRSKGDFDSNLFAKKFGGGGHKYASGARVTKGYKELIPEMLKEAKELMLITNQK